MYVSPLRAPTGLRITVLARNAVMVRWSRSDELVTSYLIQYKPVQAEDSQIKELRTAVGKDFLYISPLRRQSVAGRDRFKCMTSKTYNSWTLKSFLMWGRHSKLLFELQLNLPIQSR